VPGVIAQVTVVLHRNGQASLLASFQDDEAGSDATAESDASAEAEGGKPCAPGQTSCSVDGGMSCVDLASNANNCGACGIVCPVGSACCNRTCGGAPPGPCLTFPCGACGPNSVQCTGSNNNVCTPSEALIVQRDISKGNLGGGQSTVTSCYQCLVSAACINGTTFSIAGHECDDLSGTVGSGAQATEANAQACLNTLQCLLSTNCANAPFDSFPTGPNDGIANCYCGPVFPTAIACTSATGATVNGACAQVEVDGLGDTTSAGGGTILQFFTVKTLPSGMANAILRCAGTNTARPACPQCYQ
jgi:hypothetical protein